MNKIHKTAIVANSPEEMFDLVSDIDNYPKYLPWCTKAEILNTDNNQVTGSIYIEYLKIKTHFTTKNINTRPNQIDMSLVEGPFKNFSGKWVFEPLGDSGCKIDFYLQYQFNNHMLEKIIGPAFSYISKNIVNCFIKQAKLTYL